MNELKNMTDYELAQRVSEYRNRLSQLMSEVSQFLNDGTGFREKILEEYKSLKNDVKADAHYVDLVVNHKGRAKKYHDIAHSLSEAAAFGFAAPTNSPINQKFYSSIEEAHYKLGKCYPETILEDASQQ